MGIRHNLLHVLKTHTFLEHVLMPSVCQWLGQWVGHCPPSEVSPRVKELYKTMLLTVLLSSPGSLSGAVCGADAFQDTPESMRQE